MSERQDVLDRLQRHFPGRRAWCGQDPGQGLADLTEWRDWTHQPTTPDQLRIERFLDRRQLEGTRILHIGCGNSSLALRFAGRAQEIVGTTVVREEQLHAAGLALPGYRCLLHNKFHGAGPLAGARFDFIVDNNPTTFACCLWHVVALLRSYADALQPGGLVVTDRQGLGHSLADHPADCHLGMDFAGLARLAAEAGLRVRRHDRNVYLLGHRFPRRDGLAGQLGALLGHWRD